MYSCVAVLCQHLSLQIQFDLNQKPSFKTKTYLEPLTGRRKQFVNPQPCIIPSSGKGSERWSEDYRTGHLHG